MDWRERLRTLWVERAVWMRHYILSLMMGLRDLSFIATRLLRNGAEIALIVSYFYGTEIAGQLENLLTQNVLFLSELASTVKLGGNIEPMAANWNNTASELRELLLKANPHFNRSVWETYINDQFRLQMDLALSLSKEKYSEGISNFDFAYDNANKIAHQMIEGIETQFNLGMILPTGNASSGFPSPANHTMG